MRLSMFKGAETRFLKGIILGFLLMSGLTGKGVFHVHGSYDLDKDGLVETLILNTRASSAIWVEISKSSIADTIWTYLLPNGQKFNDAEVVDLNNDGYHDLVAVVEMYSSTENQPWLYVFSGNETGFSKTPFTVSKQFSGSNIVRPSNLSLIPGASPKISLALGAPLRYGFVFDILLSTDGIRLENVQKLVSPIISNGYGLVFTGGFSSHGGHYVAMMVHEKNQLKTAIFDIDQNYKLIQSDLLKLNDARIILGADIQDFESKRSNKNGLLIPFGSDDVFLLEVDGTTTQISNTSLSGKGAFPISNKDSEINLAKIMDSRNRAEVNEVQSSISHYLTSRDEKNQLSPPSPPLTDEAASLNSVPMAGDADLTSLPGGGNGMYNTKSTLSEKTKIYNALTPTLGDYLASVKKDMPKESGTLEKTSVPIMNIEMASETWADEAGFTRVNLGEYSPEKAKLDSAISPIPEKDSGISSFTKTVQKALTPIVVDSDTMLDMQSENEIDLYYVLAMTPVSETKDRYIFDGEVPFGVAVNQVPPMGEATHFQHGISANLANLKRGETFDFAYSLRDARLDSITTLTMVHDMQTNVVFMSISPTQDSLSQSYQPEAFDPKLFEFPDYFFEGFPTSLDMDFTDKLIRFSFDGDDDSVYQGIYLSSTTPSMPSQSLAVFMDDGTLQAVRGEVVVRANGSKKVTTEFDLVGKVEPAVMFSRLIQEMFPDELKIKLLQGASLEEPLFGPAGKLPKITREPRLPDAQPEQTNPEIPVEPKQSNVPEKSELITDEAVSNDESAPSPQEDEITPEVVKMENPTSVPAAPADTLKLENRKEPVAPIEDGVPAEPEESQPDNESEKEKGENDDESGGNE